MKRITILFCFYSIITALSAQITFEKGYFIDTIGNRTECVIRFTEWKNNPTEFKYKLKEQGDEQVGSLQDSKEFGVYNLCRYIRKSVKIDGSSTSMASLSLMKAPEWYEKTIFLQVLLDGKASLYFYEHRDSQRFFYSVDGSDIKQLVCKQYQATGPNGTSAYWNNEFRLQLWMEMKCPDEEMEKMEALGYNQKELLSYFKTYNACMGSSLVTYNPKKKFSQIHFSITPGINYSSMSFIHYSMFDIYSLDFGSGIFPRIGVESEFVLPFNRNKWCLIVEPNYQYFKGKSTNTLYKKYEINYRSIEIPVGLRYYVFLNKDLKIFLNGFYILPWNINFNPQPNQGELCTFNNHSVDKFAIGIGCCYNRFGLEARYHTATDPLSDPIYWSSKYNRLTFIAAIKLF
jgi:hypothetical protein